jgi:hypothetical protein
MKHHATHVMLLGIEALRSKASLPDSWVWEKQVSVRSLRLFIALLEVVCMRFDL